MRPSMLGNKPDGHGPASVKKDSLSLYNNPAFREASKKVAEARALLMSCGLTEGHANTWIKSWAFVYEGD